MRGSFVAVAVGALVALPAAAHADWYYKWWCSGQCAPGQLGIGETVGPFSTEASCDEARASDSHERLGTVSGNLANVDYCYETDHEDTSDTSNLSTNGHHAGILRFYVGPSVAAVSDAQPLAASGWTFGLQLARGAVPGDHLYVFLELGGSEADITHGDPAMTSQRSELDVVLGGEYMFGDGKLTELIQLGAGVVHVTMDDQTDALGLVGGVGFDYSLSDRTGLLVYGAASATTSLPATMFAVIAIEFRSAQLAALRE